MIAGLSSYLSLQPDDLIFTGTPEGVGRVNVGDVMEISCAELPTVRVTVIES